MSEERPEQNKLVCPLCHGEAFTWGYVRGNNLSFTPENAPTLKEMALVVTNIVWFASGMRCAVCNRCKHMLMFLER